MEDLKMLTREEVAEFLHVHVNTVSMLREVGIIALRQVKIICFLKKLFELSKMTILV